MAFADSLRVDAPTMSDVADLIDSLYSKLYAAQAWTPTYGTFAGSVSGTTATSSAYKILENSFLYFSINSQIVLTSAASAYLKIFLPVANGLAAIQNVACDIRVDSGNYYGGGVAWVAASSTEIQVQRPDLSNWPINTGSNKHEVRLTGLIKI